MVALVHRPICSFLLQIVALYDRPLCLPLEIIVWDLCSFCLFCWIDNTYLPKIYQQHPFIITMKWSRSWSGLRQPPYPRLCWNLVQTELNYYFNGSSVAKFMMKEFGDPRDRWSKGILRASIVPSRKFWGSAIKKIPPSTMVLFRSVKSTPKSVYNCDKLAKNVKNGPN